MPTLESLPANDLVGVTSPQNAWRWCTNVACGVAFGFSACLAFVGVTLTFILLSPPASTSLPPFYALCSGGTALGGAVACWIMRTNLPPLGILWRTMSGTSDQQQWPPGLVDWVTRQMNLGGGLGFAVHDTSAEQHRNRD